LASPSVAFEKMAYQVVVNHEEQYSILPKNGPVPRGWKATGSRGSLEKCQNYIEEVWTDMRPLSVRDWEGKDAYYVVINHEEQYAVWPVGKETLPKGWKRTGKGGSRRECQDYIEEVWTDMRPLSVRRKSRDEK
jgi:MbtH protein